MMYTRTVSSLIGMVVLIIAMSGVPLIHASGQSSTDYSIPSDVLSGGGGTSSSTDYTISYSIGQPAVIGPSAATDYDVHAGFWARIPSELCIRHGDVFPNPDTCPTGINFKRVCLEWQLLLDVNIIGTSF